jgi:hypothetical protein
MEERPISTYCAWCKKHSTKWNPPLLSPMSRYEESSHGMCPECFDNSMKKFKKQEIDSNLKESFQSFEEFIFQNLKN